MNYVAYNGKIYSKPFPEWLDITKAVEYTPDPVRREQERAAEEVIHQKRIALDSISVTTSFGKVFDGNDAARESMLSAIQASSVLNLTEYNWKLADNTWTVVTLDELKEAHALAIVRKGQILAGTAI